MVPELWKLSHLSLSISVKVGDSGQQLKGVMGWGTERRVSFYCRLPGVNSFINISLLCCWGCVTDLWFPASAGFPGLLGEFTPSCAAPLPLIYP